MELEVVNSVQVSASPGDFSIQSYGTLKFDGSSAWDLNTSQIDLSIR